MSLIEEDIRSTPGVLRQTIERVEERGDALARELRGPVVFLGSGSSYCVGVAAASIYEQTRGAPAQALLGSEYHPRPGWMHIGTSRTGKTSELIAAMHRIWHLPDTRLGLIVGDPESAAEAYAKTAVLRLEFASEAGIIQTRFISAALMALRLLIGDESSRRHIRGVPDQVERGLATFDPAPLTSFDHLVFLGRGWRYGLALAARLNLAETALMVAEGHQTLDYRHGPIASADERTCVWCFDPLNDEESGTVLDDVRRTGATIRWTGDDPLVSLAQTQLLAVRLAQARGVDPDAPRHLTRAIVLPPSGK